MNKFHKNTISILSTQQDIAEHTNADIQVSVSWFEIYNEAITDLFGYHPPPHADLKIKDDPKNKSFVIQGLTVLHVSSPEEVFELINK